MPGTLQQAATVAATVLSVITGSFFLLAGLLKIFGNQLPFWKWAKKSYLLRYPVWVYYASGLIEIATGLGILIKSFRFCSALILILMILLLSIHPRKPKEKASGIWSALISILILGFIAYMA